MIRDVDGDMEPSHPIGPGYQPRLADAALNRYLGIFPAVLINGPRAAGKTTTARQAAIAEVRLDQPAQAAAFRADPDAALRGRPEPLLLDEWQEVPEVLGAVKRAVDDDPRPGRYILTGSVRSELEHRVWPGTGRLIRLDMYAMTQREIAAHLAPGARTMVDTIRRCDPGAFILPARRFDLRDYVEIAVRGGFPSVILNSLSASDSRIWADSYLDQLLTRDVLGAVGSRAQRKLQDYFRAVAAMSGGVPEHKTLYDAVGIDRNTATSYDMLLSDLFIAESVPAWAASHLDRLVRRPKRYVSETSVMAAALGVDADAILARDDLLGRMIDTFVMSQLRPELAAAQARLRCSHARTKQGREEVDIIVELPGGQVIGIEVKASASPSSSDFRHLRWLRSSTADRFIAGVVFHTGPDVVHFDRDLFAVPISAFWG